MHKLIVFFMWLAGIGVCYGQAIAVKYDRFKDETIIHAPSEDAAIELAQNTGAPTPMLAVRFVGKDPSADTPTAAMLFFIVTVRTPADELCDSVDLIVDARRVPRLKFRRVGRNEPTEKPSWLLASQVSMELMAEIVTASKVEFQLCTQVGLIPSPSRHAMQRELTRPRK